jgi:hypothetical protein
MFRKKLKSLKFIIRPTYGCLCAGADNGQGFLENAIHGLVGRWKIGFHNSLEDRFTAPLCRFAFLAMDDSVCLLP